MATEAAELPPSSPADQEVFELSTTVDPSFIIRLIRQFLTSDHIDKSSREPSLCGEYAPTVTLVDENSDREATNSQRHIIVGSCPAQASIGLIQSSPKLVHDASGEIGSEHLACQEAREEIKDVQPVTETGECLSRGQGTGPTFHEEEYSPHEHRTVQKTPEELREEAGCMLWDLAAAQDHAEFMVQNHVLDVLLAILRAPHSDRLREVCLGILGNLACHAEPVKAVVQTVGLPSEIIQSLFVDDSPSLSETCRFLSASLHSDQADSWVKTIDSQEILERVMWIAANTMNSLLLEKSTELLLAMVDCEGSTASVLMSSLVRLGLPAVLEDLLAAEVTAVKKGIHSHGNMVLDDILQIAEALSLADDAGRQLAENSKLFMLACQVIELSGDEEVGPAAITATVLVANLLAERGELINEISQDMVLVRQLLELLPTASDDPGARNACWSILGRLSSEAASRKEVSSLTTEMALVFARGLKVLLQDLQEYEDAECAEEAENSRGFVAKLEAVDSVLCLMEEWMKSNKTNEKQSDAYKIVANSSSALRSWLSSADPEKTLKSRDDDLLENGIRET